MQGPIWLLLDTLVCMPIERKRRQSQRIAAELNTGTYNLILTVQRWYYLFDRHNRRQIMSDSLHYCQDNKGLELNGYVFMLNPIHPIVTSQDVRDFKPHPNSCIAEINLGSLIRSFIFSPWVAVLYGNENKRLHGIIYTLQHEPRNAIPEYAQLNRDFERAFQ